MTARVTPPHPPLADVRAVCFDWGGTLMAEHGGPDDVPMALWPTVTVIDGALDAVAALRGRLPLAIATNASVSTRPMIERALRRVGLHDAFDQVFCYTELGCRKDEPAFWDAVSVGLGVPTARIAMVGDSLEQDARAPRRFGVQGVWFDPDGALHAGSPADVPVVHTLPDFAAWVLAARLTTRDATADDADALAAVHVASWRAAYAGLLDGGFLAGLSVERRARGWRDILAGGGTVRLAFAGERLAGFVSHGPCRDDGAAPDQGEIHALYADPADWGTGVGRRLLDEAVALLRAAGRPRISLWVLADNARAIGFYRAAGFEVVDGSRKAFELGGRTVDEVAMRLAAGPG